MGILTMCHNEEPYAVPINHAYRDGKLYFHCATTGKKLDMIRANPRVCYVVNNDFGNPGDFANGARCHGNWESVIVRGRARVIDDPDQLRDAFSIFMEYYSSVNFQPGKNSVKTTRIIIVDVESMAARREVPREGFNPKTGEGKVDVDYWAWSQAGVSRNSRTCRRLVQNAIPVVSQQLNKPATCSTGESLARN